VGKKKQRKLAEGKAQTSNLKVKDERESSCHTRQCSKQTPVTTHTLLSKTPEKMRLVAVSCGLKRVKETEGGLKREAKKKRGS